MDLKSIVLWGAAFLTLSSLLGCGPDKKDSGERKSYIVVYKKAPKVGAAYSLSSEHDLPAPEKIFSASIQGGVFTLTQAEASALAEDDAVAYVEEDGYVYASAVQSNPTWGLDRVDQANLPLDRTYNYTDSGANVNVYVIDTGVKVSHQEFQGRATSGYDFVDRDANADDCNGHGTHVAGTVAGKTYGVAKAAKIVGVRVLSCSGSGRTSDVIAGIDWVTQNHQKPAIANMSLGGGASQALDDAIRNSVQSGVTYVVAAGNDDAPACSGSPARVAEVLTVGASTKSDRRSDFSNHGACVDIFAPGSDIISAWYSGNTVTKTISGTSMASPHVAGIAAIYLGKNSSATPTQVMAAVVGGAGAGKLGDVKSGSPNLLLNTAFLADVPNTDPIDQPDDGNLNSGDLVQDLSGAKASTKRFKISTAPEASRLKVEIFGGTGDADLYVRRGSEPQLSVYDCRPYYAGNSEVCEFTGVGQGEYHIMLYGYSDFAKVSLKVEVVSTGGDRDPCSQCVSEVGQLMGSGHFLLHPKGSYYQSTQTETHSVWLQASPLVDFDLFLKKWDGFRWVNVASSAKSGSEENVRFTGGPGFYTIEVRSFLGFGAYQVWMKRGD